MSGDGAGSIVWIAGHVASGQLSIGPDAAQALSKECDVYLDKMAKLQDAAATVVDVAAYGTLDSSRALGQKFYDMMCGSRADSPSLVDAYQMRIDEIRRAQIEFTKYFQAAESHDGATAAAIRQHQL